MVQGGSGGGVKGGGENVVGGEEEGQHHMITSQVMDDGLELVDLRGGKSQKTRRRWREII